MLLRDAGLEPLPLKLFGRVRRPGLEAGLVAAFNANKTAKLVVGSLSRTDVEGLAGPAVAVFAHGTQHATVLDERHRTQSVRLDEYGAALYTLVPIEHGAAVFGLLDKFVGPAAVKQVRRERTALHVTLDEGGTFGAYLVRAPRAVHVDGRKLEPRGYRYASGLLQVPIGAQGREVRVTLAP